MGVLFYWDSHWSSLAPGTKNISLEAVDSSCYLERLFPLVFRGRGLLVCYFYELVGSFT